VGLPRIAIAAIDRDYDPYSYGIDGPYLDTVNCIQPPRTAAYRLDDHYRIGSINMSFASSSARTLRARTIPIATASAISVSIYAVYTTWQNPLLAEDLTQETVASINKTKTKFALPSTASPYTPLGWGNNRNLTLSADQQIANVKKPAPLTFIGATPLRDLVVAERYGACIDARGDCWMWGTGYDPSGELGRSLKGKVSLSSAIHLEHV